MQNIVCSGPGPHMPANGVLGTADQPVLGMLCPSIACQAATVAAGVAAAAATANQATLQQQAQSAMATNRSFIGIASPTNAQVIAQLKALSQQNIGLIRLLLNQFDATN